MGHGHHQFDVSGALAAHVLLCHLDTASVANNAFVAYALVFSAPALIVACRTEDALAEESVALRFVGAVVDGLRLCHLAIRVFQDFLW